MKKLKLSLLIAFLGIISLVTAQNVSFSVKGGLNMSSFYGDNLTDNTAKPGFHIGVGTDLELMQNISLQTGLYFSSKGAKFNYNSPVKFIDDLEYNTTTNYLQLPIHIAYKMDITQGTKLVLHAGPYLAYGISGKRKIESKYSSNFDEYLGGQEINTFDKNFGFKPFDVGIGVGVGMEFKKIVFDLGWDMGLNNIARELKTTTSTFNQNIKNQSAYLSLGYKF